MNSYILHKGLIYQSSNISLLTLIQNFVSRYILKGKRCKIYNGFYRPDIHVHVDSDTAWPTVRGTPNQIINLYQRSPPHLLLGYTITLTVL